MTDSIFYALFWVIIVYVWLRYSRLFRDEALGQTFQYGFLLKAAAGFLFVFVYTHYYGANDAFAYLKDSKVLNDTFFKSPAVYFRFLTGIGTNEQLVDTYLSDTKVWSRGTVNLVNDSQNIIRINSLIYFVSRGNPYIHTTFMALFSVIGLRELTLAFRHRISVNPKIILAGLILLPSVLFWTSGILKEPVLILGMGILARGIIGTEIGWTKWARLIAGVVILAGIKPYVLICILVALMYYGIAQLIFKTKPILSLLVFSILFTGLFAVLPHLRELLAINLTLKQKDTFNVSKGGLYAARDSTLLYYFRVSDYDKLKVEDSVVELIEPVLASQSWVRKNDSFEPVYLSPKKEKWKLYLLLDSSSSLIRITPISGSFAQLVKNVPEALVNATLRPFPWDPGSMMTYPAIAEVIGCMGFLLIAVIYRRKLDIEDRKILITLILFCVGMLLLVGWTTPVLGAIVRYRIPAYMIIFITSIFIIRIDFVECFTIPKKWKRTIQ